MMNVLERIKTFDWSQRLSLSLKHYYVDREGYHSESYVSDKEAEQELIKLAEIGERMQWVNAKEWFPKENENVLIIYNNEIHIGYRCDIGWDFGDNFASYGDKKLTHWMPLPNKPI